MKGWQGGGDGAHVADGAYVYMAEDSDGGNDDDGDEGGRDGGGEVWKEVDDDDAEENESNHRPAFSCKVA